MTRDARTGGLGATLRSNVARIAKFFDDVSTGGGVRVQQGAQAMLPLLRASLMAQATETEARMAVALANIEQPLISFVVPTHNTSAGFLRDLVESFVVQKAGYAELILSDDGSDDPAMRVRLDAAAARPGVRVLRNPRNRGIAAATNTGIAAARGRWTRLRRSRRPAGARHGGDRRRCDRDAPPAPSSSTPDELIVDAALTPIGEFCKPAWDPVLLSGQNYINHLSVFRADRLAALGGLREDREGSQDYDLLLRYLADAPAASVVHIPYLAYLWRRETASYSMLHSDRAIASARRALALAHARDGVPVHVEPALAPGFHRVRLPGPEPLVSIVIPNRDSFALIGRVVAGHSRQDGLSAKGGGHRRQRHARRQRAAALRGVASRRGSSSTSCRSRSISRGCAIAARGVRRAKPSCS